jgi:hypothetical protein
MRQPPLWKRSVRLSPAATRMESLAQVSAGAGRRMGHQLPRSPIALAPNIRPDEPEAVFEFSNEVGTGRTGGLQPSPPLRAKQSDHKAKADYRDRDRINVHGCQQNYVPISGGQA